MRQIKIKKYENNTHYSVYVVDKYNQEHHLGYEHTLNNDILAKIEQQACDIWADEVKHEPSSMDLAISALIKLDEQSGLHFTDDRGNHRDGLD
tara:strand:- start:163 stop:441 length:279 start_codon:yes stop_codon:yes gene_type:complete